MFKPTAIDSRGHSASGAAVLAYLMESEHKLTARACAIKAFVNPAMAYYQSPSVTAAFMPTPGVAVGADGKVRLEGGESADRGEEPVLIERSTSRWLGKGATALGLTGEVRVEDMEALAAGFAPGTGEALSPSAGQKPTWVPKTNKQGQPILDKHGEQRGYWKGGHRVGYDCTLSIADKSASLVFADATPEERIRIMDAYRDTVAEVVDVMETKLEAGRGQGGKEKIGLRGLVASGHFHLSSRELECNLHEHVMLYAVGQGEDGKWSGINADTIFNDQRMYGALGRAGFARRMQELGYGIEKRVEIDADGRETGEVYYRVAGVSETACDANSTRRQQIIEHVEQFGGSKDQAALRTRKDKEEPAQELIDDIWSQTFTAQRAEDPTFFRSVDELKGLPSKLEGIEDDALLRKLHRSDAVWTKEDLVTQLALENVGRMSVPEITAEADAFLGRLQPDIALMNPEHSPEKRHQAQRPGRKFREDRYAANFWIDETEQKMVDSAKARQNEPHLALPETAIAKAIKKFQEERGFTISEEQRLGVSHVTGGQGVSLITGRAGTGKTTVASIFCDAYASQGFEVIGVALANKASRKLKAETGVEQCYSAAKFLHELDKDNIHLHSKSVVVLDEAGMADTGTLSEISKRVNAANGKLICMGDAHQLQPVGPGAGFRLLKDAVGDAQLTEIRRQRDAEDLATTNLFYTHADKARHTTTRGEQATLGAQIMSRLEARDQVEHTDTEPESIELIADNYSAKLGSVSENGKRLGHGDLFVMAGTRANVRALNEAIRERLKETGEVDATDHILHTKDDRGVKRDVALAVGDLVAFGKKNKDLAVDNGTTGTIEAVKQTAKGSLMVSVKLVSEIPEENGRLVKFDTQQYDRLDHAFAWTIHKTQGGTVEESMLLATCGTTNVHSMLVAASRARGKFTMYGAETDLEMIEERIGLERLSANALEEGRKGTPRAEPAKSPSRKRPERHTAEPKAPSPEQAAAAKAAKTAEDTARQDRAERIYRGYRDLMDKPTHGHERGPKIKIRRGD